RPHEYGETYLPFFGYHRAVQHLPYKILVAVCWHRPSNDLKERHLAVSPHDDGQANVGSVVRHRSSRIHILLINSGDSALRFPPRVFALAVLPSTHKKAVASGFDNKCDCRWG